MFVMMKNENKNTTHLNYLLLLHSPMRLRRWCCRRWNSHDDELTVCWGSCQKQKTVERYPHPSGWLNKRSAMRYTLHHLQQHNRIRPSSRSYHGSATDYHAVSLVKRTEGHQIMATATQKRRLMIGMIVRKLCRRSWMQWGNRPTWLIIDYDMSGNYALLLVGLARRRRALIKSWIIFEFFKA